MWHMLFNALAVFKTNNTPLPLHTHPKIVFLLYPYHLSQACLFSLLIREALREGELCDTLHPVFQEYFHTGDLHCLHE